MSDHEGGADAATSSQDLGNEVTCHIARHRTCHEEDVERTRCIKEVGTCTTASTDFVKSSVVHTFTFVPVEVRIEMCCRGEVIIAISFPDRVHKKAGKRDAFIHRK